MRGKEIRIRHIKFSSFYKLSIMISLAFGVVVGLVLFFTALLGGNVTAQLNGVAYEGVTAGIIALFLSPILLIIIGSMISIIVFLPTWAALKLTKGIQLKGDFEWTDSAVE